MDARRLPLLLALVLVASGCFHHAYVVSGTVPEQEPATSRWQHHLFNGLVDFSGPVDLRDSCPQGVSRIENGMAFLQMLIYFVTATIYAPTTATVYCQAAHAIPEPNPDDAGVSVPPEPSTGGAPEVGREAGADALGE